MYADFTYYQTEYGGRVIKSMEDYNHFARKAARRMDTITTGKLQSAFPTDGKVIEAVRDCECELAEFLYQLVACQDAAMDSMGVVEQADGTVKGKVITSVSSGSESIGYSVGGSTARTSVMEAAKDKKVADIMIYDMLRNGLGGMADSNGISLLYAGIG